MPVSLADLAADSMCSEELMDEFREDWEPAVDALNDAVPWRKILFDCH